MACIRGTQACSNAETRERHVCCKADIPLTASKGLHKDVRLDCKLEAAHGSQGQSILSTPGLTLNPRTTYLQTNFFNSMGVRENRAGQACELPQVHGQTRLCALQLRVVHHSVSRAHQADPVHEKVMYALDEYL